MLSRQAAHLRDVLHAVESILGYVEGQRHEGFLRDRKTQDAVLFRFLVAGEAAARMTPEARAEARGVPFDKLSAMRNRAVHDYGHIDAELLWNTVQFDLPPVQVTLRQFFEAREAQPTSET